MDRVAAAAGDRRHPRDHAAFHACVERVPHASSPLLTNCSADVHAKPVRFDPEVWQKKNERASIRAMEPSDTVQPIDRWWWRVGG